MDGSYLGFRFFSFCVMVLFVCWFDPSSPVVVQRAWRRVFGRDKSTRESLYLHREQKSHPKADAKKKKKKKTCDTPSLFLSPDQNFEIVFESRQVRVHSLTDDIYGRTNVDG